MKISSMIALIWRVAAAVTSQKSCRSRKLLRDGTTNHRWTLKILHDQSMMEAPDFNRPIFAPVILGTSRQGRASEYAAHFVVDHVAKRPDMQTDLIDIRNIRLSIDDAGEAIKDPKFSKTVNDADALIFVVPEYNHSFPGLLKHVLDTNLKEYIHKAAGVCGVSAGPFGGARMIQNFCRCYASALADAVKAQERASTNPRNHRFRRKWVSE
jgi:NAD(P)H-dependent FMN reductase